MKSKKVTLGLFVYYLIVLVWIIIFKFQFALENLPHIRNINLIPFAQSVIVNGELELNEIINNAMAFIPFGLFIHILWEQKSLVKQILPIIGTSLLFEIIQFLFSIGATDITDIISNSLGGIVGIMVAFSIHKVIKNNWIKIINIISIIGAIFLTLFIVILLLANL